MPNPSSVANRNQILTNVSQSYVGAQKFIADMACPRLTVTERAGRFYVYNKRDVYSVPDTKASANSDLNQADWGATLDTFKCNDTGLREFITQEELEKTDNPLNARVDATAFVSKKVDLAREDRVATLLTTAGSYAASNKDTLAGVNQWNDYDNSDPVADIQTAIDALFEMPTHMIMSDLTFGTLKNHPDIIDRVKYSTATSDNPAKATPATIAALFGFEAILIGSARKDTTPKKSTATYGRVWGKDVVIGKIDQSPSLRSLTLAMTFDFGGRYVQIVRDDVHGSRGGEWVKVVDQLDEELITPDIGYLIIDAIA